MPSRQTVSAEGGYQIDPKRLAHLPTLHLASGAHETFEQGACAMEMVSWLAREKFSDHPKCASPVIGAFMRAWNDGLPDDERDALILPLIPRLVGTRGSQALEERRSLMAADWLVRTHAVAWLRLAGLTTQADLLASLPEITSMAQVPSIRAPLEAIRKDAAAARAAAAAGAAARDAAGPAAWAAWAAARAAAGAIAWAAAEAAAAAAWAAAGAKLKPTRDELQRSALVLVKRMIDAKEVA